MALIKALIKLVARQHCGPLRIQARPFAQQILVGGPSVCWPRLSGVCVRIGNTPAHCRQPPLFSSKPLFSIKQARVNQNITKQTTNTTNPTLTGRRPHGAPPTATSGRGKCLLVQCLLLQQGQRDLDEVDAVHRSLRTSAVRRARSPGFQLMQPQRDRCLHNALF